MSEATFKCRSCGKEHSLEVYASVNVAENPEVKPSVKDGSLFVWQCPSCGTTNLAKYPFLYHDPTEKLMVWLLPDGETEVSEKHLKAVADQLEGYTLRRVNEVGDLIEKINIHDVGLDDIVMEICKYVTKMELAEKAGNKAKDIMDATFRFYRMEGADNDIIITFPLDGQMQGTKISFKIYEDCRGILLRNPSIAPPTGFSRIDADWISQHFR